MYPPEMLDYDKYMERNQCPVNDQLCEEAIWLFHNILIAKKKIWMILPCNRKNLKKCRKNKSSLIYLIYKPMTIKKLLFGVTILSFMAGCGQEQPEQKAAAPFQLPIQDHCNNP
jgi:hypothetical protein